MRYSIRMVFDKQNLQIQPLFFKCNDGVLRFGIRNIDKKIVLNMENRKNLTKILFRFVCKTH